jgi:hypothetical protein
VLCLQEVVRTPSAQAEWLAYLDGDLELPQSANLLDEIRAAFPTHDAFFCPTARGALHDSDAKTVRSEFGLATFPQIVSLIGHRLRSHCGRAAGTDMPMPIGLYNDGRPRSPDTGIDNTEKHGVCRN